MGSDTNNKITVGTSFQPSEPTPCTTGCGFFGTAATNGFCSKCFRDIQITAKQSASAKDVVDKLVNTLRHQTPSSSSPGSEPLPAPVIAVTEKITNRCLTCNKKVGEMGFKCRCGETFCGSHRYPEKHDCEFDFKRTGREAIAMANPVIKADKMDRI